MKKHITASKLLSLAFDQLALKHGCWISPDKELLHQTIFNLKQKIGTQLYPLSEMHFVVRGAYPYSNDLSTAMWMLHESGFFNSYKSGGVTTKVQITVHDDTEEVVDKLLTEIFKDNLEERQAFNELVDGLKVLLVSPP